ncbi:MAG TPA: anti-sigma factor, partial [Pyrinomonadaceae bacterium]
MSKRKQVRRLTACACVWAAAAGLAANFYPTATAGPRPKPPAAARRAQAERVDIRLRSLTTRATGQLTVEASEGGGRARLTALNLPDPQTVAAGSTVYVVWAVSGGRIRRLGELRRDERGNGGLAFERPAGLERYGVIVTAESAADVERPGDPVLTTRADEAAA